MGHPRGVHRGDPRRPVQQAQREMASSLFFSTVLSIVTLGAFIALT
jgi:hypothetical protein